MSMPPISASASGAASGKADQGTGFSADGFVVNYGGGVSSSGASSSALPAVPWYVWVAVSIGAVLWAKKQR